MRKLIIPVLALAGFMACDLLPSKNAFELSGKLEGAADGKVILQPARGTEGIIDTVEIKNGIFAFKGAIDAPDMYLVRLEEGQGGCYFFLDNEQIKLTGHVDSLSHAKITGSAYEVEKEAFAETVKELEGKYPLEELKKEYYNPETTAERKEEIGGIYDQYMKEMTILVKEYIKGHPASYFSAMKLREISYELEAEELEALLNGLDAKLADFSHIVKLRDYAQKMKAVAIGKIAPEFTMNDTEGNPVKLSDVYAKSQYLLIDFWASWCSPCRAENPNVVEAYKKFNEKGFDVFGVSLDKDKEQWLEAIEKDELTWTHVSDLKGWGNEAAKLYAVRGIPANLLVDNTGKIIAKQLRGEDLHKKLEELLK